MLDDEKLMLVLPLLRLEYDKARAKHPVFPREPAKALAIVTEEVLELARAVNDNESAKRVREEAAHVAVTALRLLAEVHE